MPPQIATGFWREIQSGKYKNPGMFTLRTAPALLDIVESLIGPEILAHPQYALRAKMPAHEETVVPWHSRSGISNSRRSSRNARGELLDTAC